MAKAIKVKSSPTNKSLFLSKFLLFLGIALFFLVIGVMIGQQTSQNKRLLFFQDVEKGSMVPLEGKKDTYDLSVKNANNHVTYFSESPQKTTGRMSIAQYLDVWTTYFSQNNPYVTLTTYDDEGNAQIIIGKLETAKIHGNKNRIDYTFRMLNDGNEQKRIDKFKTAILSIDATEYQLAGGNIIKAFR